MSITFRCEHCHKNVNAPDNAAGKRGKCPHCKQSSYIPTPVSEEDVIPLAPEKEETRDEELERLREQELELITQDDPDSGLPPLEYREGVEPEDLYHFVVNYVLDMANSRLERAPVHAAKLRKFGTLGVEAVDDFLKGRAKESALQKLPEGLVEGFLNQLRDEVKT